VPLSFKYHICLLNSVAFLYLLCSKEQVYDCIDGL